MANPSGKYKTSYKRDTFGNLKEIKNNPPAKNPDLSSFGITARFKI